MGGRIVAREWAHARHGEWYLALMYDSPQAIWVTGLVRQSAPAVAILVPGRDCGMP